MTSHMLKEIPPRNPNYALYQSELDPTKVDKLINMYFHSPEGHNYAFTLKQFVDHGIIYEFEPTDDKHKH